MLVLKGCAMGAADVVPGVSGGTIAFITGIYEELINSIKSIDLQALKLLLTFKLAEFWKKINGTFLLSVVGGIAISIFSLAKLMTWLLVNHPIYIWSFFFGLIIISSVLVAKEIKKWDIFTIISLLAEPLRHTPSRSCHRPPPLTPGGLSFFRGRLLFAP